jgi:hypothetical protein
MLLTLDAAGLANFCANTADFRCELRVATQEQCCGPADGRTVAVKPDALNHALDIVLVQTGIRAMLTLLGAPGTRLDTRLVLAVNHTKPPSDLGAFLAPLRTFLAVAGSGAASYPSCKRHTGWGKGFQKISSGGWSGIAAKSGTLFATQTATIIFPLPLEVMRAFLKSERVAEETVPREWIAAGVA